MPQFEIFHEWILPENVRLYDESGTIDLEICQVRKIQIEMDTIYKNALVKIDESFATFRVSDVLLELRDGGINGIVIVIVEA